MEKAKVSIIFVNWNNTQDTIQAIKEVKKQTYTNYEIIVVDNDSPDRPKERFNKEFSNTITYLETGENVGYCGGNNAGITYALKQKSKYILLLNSDVYLDKNFLQYLIEAMEKDNHLGAVSPKIYYYNEPKKIWFIDGPINWIKGTTHSKHQGEIDNGQFNKERYSNRLPGTAFLTRSSILKKIGGLDEKYFMYMEDVDISERVKRAGYKLKVIPTSILWHNESSVSGGSDSPKIIYYYTRNKLLFMKKYGTNFEFITSTMYEVYFCLRRFASHILKRKLKLSTIKATIYAFQDFCQGKIGKLDKQL